MGRSTSGRSSSPRRRIRPRIEGLEERWVPSNAAGGLPIVADSSPLTGEFFNHDQQFNYTTPEGTHVAIKIIGKGSLQGTTVDSNGALHLLFSRTNAYTRIFSDVHGGSGQANLASIYSRDLFDNSAQTSLSGIGASLIRTINLPQFNLIAGGVIDVASGIGILNLNSVGPNTQINLRVLPDSYLTSFQTANSNSGVTASTNPTTANTSSSSSSTSTSNSSTITSGTTSNNNSSIVVTGAFTVQSLAGINGEFVSAGNIINVSSSGTPGPTPAPPGLVLKINRINGNINTAPNLLTDNDIFGYDPTTGQVLRFNLTPAEDSATGNVNMGKQVGTIDPTFTPLQVQPAGSMTPVAISVGRDGSRLVLLVSTGSVISVYDATSGTPIGSFTTPAGFDADALGSTDTLTVMGDVLNNHLEEIDIPLSLAAGTAQPPINPSGDPSPSSYTPVAGISLVGGLTGQVGTNQVFPTVAATFNSLQSTVTQLGFSTVGTSTTVSNSEGGLTLVRELSTVSTQAYKPSGSYIAVTPTDNPMLTGVPEGSVDSSLALNTITASSASPAVFTNTVALLGPVTLAQRGTITLKTTDPITDLSESFRPELNGSTANGTGPALIDVQGTIQSLRGLTANGLVLNNTGYLNLVRFGQISNSTILAQPIGHILTPQSNRSNVLLISSSNRDFGKRGGVNILARNLEQIGPLSLTNDSTNP